MHRVNQAANLWEYSWNGSNAQLWKFIVNSDGSYYIKSKLGTVVDIFSGIIAEGTNIQMYTANGSDAQNGNWNREKRGLMKDLLRTEHIRYQMQQTVSRF